MKEEARHFASGHPSLTAPCCFLDDLWNEAETSHRVSAGTARPAPGRLCRADAGGDDVGGPGSVRRVLRGPSGARLRVLSRVGRVPATTQRNRRTDRGSSARRIQGDPWRSGRRRVVPHRSRRGLRRRRTRSGRCDRAAARVASRCGRAGTSGHAGRLPRDGWRRRNLGVAAGPAHPARRCDGPVRLLTGSRSRRVEPCDQRDWRASSATAIEAATRKSRRSSGTVTV